MNPVRRIGTIGKRLTAIRKKSGKTQKEVADYLGINRHTWGDYERDSSKITLIDFLDALSFFKYDSPKVIKEFLNEDVAEESHEAEAKSLLINKEKANAK